MYVPSHFQAEDRAIACELIDENPFATVVVVGGDGLPLVNHLPVLLDRRGQELRLVGHMARKNPLWRAMEGRPTTFVFHGAHAYVTPRWYEEGDVPTWNYAVAHVSGAARLVQDHAGLVDVLRFSADRFEAGEPEPWVFALPADLSDERMLAAAIVGFELPLATAQITCKLKLSQNRAAVDRRGVLDGLLARGDEASLRLRQTMLRRAPLPKP